MEEKRLVTLIGAKLAEEGCEFIFLGASKKCEECRLKNSCTNLEATRRYRIMKVREEIKHDCYIHEGGVCVVEVERADDGDLPVHDLGAWGDGAVGLVSHDRYLALAANGVEGVG